MDKRIYDAYVSILKEELVPAMGCTEPIAIAFAAAIARQVLGCVPQEVEICVSGNIIKNVKSVVVPHTGGLRGIEAAAAAGIVAGQAEEMLEVLSQVTKEQIAEMAEYLQKTKMTVTKSESDKIFEIILKVIGTDHTALVHIVNHHTEVVLVQKDGVPVYEMTYEDIKEVKTDRSLLTVEQIVAFADEVAVEDVKEVLDRQIVYNTAIAKEGLNGNYGANIGRVLLFSYGDTVHNRAKAWAAAGSDARMNGCELPVVINSGSGNQGMTASLPVIVYAKELGVSEELLYRALVVSNLITTHLKTGIGSLSAYCGAISAGCGAGAGIMYLHGGRYREIAHTIVNALAINSGVVCDGAKASCAAKIASAVEAGLLGMQMFMHGNQFVGGDGIVTKGVEATIKNVGVLAREGMKETDKEILNIMLGQ